ncbi:hypothetical protein N0V93_001712 [Gnomoniopsis smithogilvyi]|uniref:Thaumatin-like protein n=1 Tax=Gnomoniopsis smithogilvyi TaxID=1191159 RepID=A0A9W8Z4B1_9PEZI|nr:hypothetical protein N0V93_001712 [Gnomoniopsis smithogilvyi]
MQTILLVPLLAVLAAAVPSYPHVTPAPLANKRDLTQITVTMVNSMAAPLTTAIASNPGVPPLASGAASLEGTLSAGGTASIVAPQGWAGNIAVGLANYTALYMPSLMEASLMTKSQSDPGFSFDIDVSYVNGYTVPIICTCNDDKTFLSGCSEDLWGQNKCGAGGETDEADKGVCTNPTNNGSFTGTAATPFFKPCEGKAYTYPSDDDANSNGKCAGGSATCCVGTTADGCPSAS